MKIVFASNYLNHHQLPLCKAFLCMENVEFCFVAVEAVSQERLNFGYSDMDSKYDFVLRAYLSPDEKEKAIQVMKIADILISGINLGDYLNKKDMQGKLIFLYLERSFRKIQFDLAFIKSVLRVIKNHTFDKRRNVYILCAGAYVAIEFKILGAYWGRMYRWGYFPEIFIKEKEQANTLKMSEIIRVLWVGRFLDWKRPQQALELAKELKQKGYIFRLDMIGSGELEDDIKEKVQNNQLEDCVNLLGSMPSDAVREHMDRADIFLFTSNREEGWGAVLNEAMGSRCAIVANRLIGAVPFLIQHGQNGLIYDGTIEDLIKKTESFMDDREKRKKLGENAYQTVITHWNANVAAKNFIQLSQRLLRGEKHIKDIEGPCGYIG